MYGVIAVDAAWPYDQARFEQQVRSAAPECSTVSATAYRDLAAIVSDSPINEITHLLRDALARLLVRHQMVVETVMSLGYTVIPMRLGTFALDEPEVREILRRGYDLIRSVVTKVADRIEMDVVTTWSDLGSILQETAAHPEIEQVKASIRANPAGVSRDDQVRVGMMVKRLLDRKRTELAREVSAWLKPVCADLREHALMDDTMIANTAFLLDRDRQHGLDRAIEELNARFHGRLNFRCVGPLPPYSFYTLEAKKLEFEKIEWARRKLGLARDSATRDDIRQAHRQKAFSCHPDRNPQGLDPRTSEFDEVTDAYRILDEYCQGERCFFDRARFRESALLVRVRS